MPIDPKTLPQVDDWEHKDLCKGRGHLAQHAYQLRTGCSADEAKAVIDYWYNLTFGKPPIDNKMMPGQAPYTPEELGKVNGLIASACEAEESFSDDELEDYAASKNRCPSCKKTYGHHTVKCLTEYPAWGTIRDPLCGCDNCH